MTVNPQVVGSSPTRGAKNNRYSFEYLLFLFLCWVSQRLRVYRMSRYRLSVAKEVGSDPTAAGGGCREGSEWQRSARSELALPSVASAGHRNSKTDIINNLFFAEKQVQQGEPKRTPILGGVLLAFIGAFAQMIYRSAACR